MSPNKKRRLQPWVGPWLREHREKGETKREDVAKKLDRDLSSIARIETGASRIPADDLPVVLEAYGLTAAQYAARARRSLSVAA